MHTGRKLYRYLLMSVFLGGCLFLPEAEIVEKNGYFYIKPKRLHIDDPSIIDWPVGPLRNRTLSKGIEFRIHLPKIPDDELLKIIQAYKIDSWIINIRRKSSGSVKTLRYFYIPIVNQASMAIQGSTTHKPHQRKDVNIKVYYVDAAVSDRFEHFQCPALGHNLVIREARLLERKSFDRFITIQSKTGSPFQHRADRYQSSSSKINGGKSLLGEYSVEIALYNSLDKRLFSNFYALKNVVKVSVERTRAIAGCANFKIPKEDDSTFILKEIFNPK